MLKLVWDQTSPWSWELRWICQWSWGAEFMLSRVTLVCSWKVWVIHYDAMASCGSGGQLVFLNGIKFWGEHLGWSSQGISRFNLPFIFKVHPLNYRMCSFTCSPTSVSHSGWILMKATAAFIFQSRLSPEGSVDESTVAARRLVVTVTPLCCLVSNLRDVSDLIIMTLLQWWVTCASKLVLSTFYFIHTIDVFFHSHWTQIPG